MSTPVKTDRKVSIEEIVNAFDAAVTRPSLVVEAL